MIGYTLNNSHKHKIYLNLCSFTHETSHQLTKIYHNWVYVYKLFSVIYWPVCKFNTVLQTSTRTHWGPRSVALSCTAWPPCAPLIGRISSAALHRLLRFYFKTHSPAAEPRLKAINASVFKPQMCFCVPCKTRKSDTVTPGRIRDETVKVLLGATALWTVDTEGGKNCLNLFLRL